MDQNNSKKVISAKDLQPGKVYDCKIDGEHGPEVLTFIQLAQDTPIKRCFILVGSLRLFAKHPEVLRNLIPLSFSGIELEDYDGAPYKVMGLSLWRCSVDSAGMNVDGYDWFLNEFV